MIPPSNILDSVIIKAKEEFLLTAWIFTYWGIIGMIIPIMVIGRNSSVYEWVNYPLLGFPVAGIILTVLIVTHSLKHKSTNPLTFIISFLWTIVSINRFILAFALPNLYKQLLVPTVLLIIAIAQITTGLILKMKVLSVTGILLNIVIWSYWFFLTRTTPQQLGSNTEMTLLIVLALIGQLIPGLVIRNKK